MQVAEKHHTDWNRAHDWLAAAAWPVLLLVICIGFFWKLTLSDQYTWLDTPDIAYHLLPEYQFQAGEWHAGRLPLWDPYLGQPVIGAAQPGAAYPFNWVLFLAPLRNGWIRQSSLHWYFVLIHFQAALFCYWLCRDLKRSHAASLLSGLAFGLGGFLGINSWPPTLNAAVWAPLVFLFFLRAMRGQRPVASAAWSGAFLGIAFLSGDLRGPIFISLAMAGSWLCYLIMDAPLRHYRLKLLLIFCLFLILASGLQTLPTIASGKFSLHSIRAPDALPSLLYELVAITMALLGAITSWKDRVTRLLAGIALGGLLASSFIFHFGLCVLIAYGIDDYQSMMEALKKAAAIVLCSFSAGVGLLIWVLYETSAPTEPRLGIVMLVGFSLAAILSAWNRGRITERSAIVWLTLVMLLELGNVTTYNYQARGEVKSLLTTLAEHSDIAAFLGHQIGPVRVQVDAHDVPYNFGDWYGIEASQAMMYGTNFQVSRTPQRTDQAEVFTGRSGVKIYENPGAFPRAWITHDQTCQAPGTVSLVGRLSNRVVLEANLKCSGMVIEADAYSPDWVATVDGKPTPLFEVNGSLRGIVLEAGSHRIEMRYRPKSVYWGAALTALGLLGAGLTTRAG
jgi:hypothetical protein